MVRLLSKCPSAGSGISLRQKQLAWLFFLSTWWVAVILSETYVSPTKGEAIHVQVLKFQSGLTFLGRVLSASKNGMVTFAN